ncbi:MAG: arylsulfatase [Pirellulaceae bacterium]|nr:arylsulfatase [Pirellulaceae bacterium]
MFIRFILPLLLVVGLYVAPVFGELANSKPNIILVMTDDQGYAPVGRHGHPWLKTPNLDSIYDASTRFTRFFVAPTCSPTRSAIMTGRHPEKNGITHTILERERMTLNATILPQVLKTVGYTSGIFGKWHLGDEHEYQPDQRGFDEVFMHGAGGIGQAYPCSCADAPDNKYMNPVIRHNGSFVQTEGFCTDVFFTAALGWIHQKAVAKEPFFAYVATNAPHGPFIAPEKNAKRFTDLGFGKEQAGFYGMIENIDENMGRLLAKLDEWKLNENTILIFMSDNGMTSGGSGVLNQDLAPGFPFYNANQKGLKGSTDEGGVRVPFYVRWTGKIKPNQDIDRIAAHIDILPTFAALTGAKLPANQVEGRNLLPLLEGKQESWQDRFVFCHICRWPTGAEPNEFKDVNFGVRNQRYRYVGPSKSDGKGKKAGAASGAALYDMQSDPSQKENIIAKNPKVVAEMQAAYDQYWKEARPLMVNETAPMSPTQPYHEWFNAQKSSTGIPNWKVPQL